MCLDANDVIMGSIKSECLHFYIRTVMCELTVSGRNITSIPRSSKYRHWLPVFDLNTPNGRYMFHFGIYCSATLAFVHNDICIFIFLLYVWAYVWNECYIQNLKSVFDFFFFSNWWSWPTVGTKVTRDIQTYRQLVSHLQRDSLCTLVKILFAIKISLINLIQALFDLTHCMSCTG